MAVTKDLRASFSKALQGIRKSRLLTQADVAQAMGMSSEVLGRMERGGLLPSLATFLMLCHVLECPPEALIGKTQAPSPRSKHALRELALQLPDGVELRRLLRSLIHASPAQLRLIRMLASGLVNPEGRKR